MALLGEEGLRATFEFFALALELGELQHPAKVRVQEPFLLAFGMGDGPADSAYFLVNTAQLNS